MTQLALFNYDHLEEDISFQVRLKTQEIQNDLSVTATHVVRIGERLSQVKALLGHGHFGAWLDHEFGWSERSARNYISVYEVFKSENIADLGIATSALYLLASPSTPEEARTEALDIARTGETITPSRAKEIIESHKAPVTVEIRGSADGDNLLDWAKPVDYFPEPEDDDSEPVMVSVQRSNYEPKTDLKLDVNDFTPAKIDGKLTLVPKSALAETDGQSSASMRSPDHFTEKHKSAKTDNHPTPPKITDFLYSFYKIDLDPCSDLDKNIKAKRHYTIEDNGLEQSWQGNLFINPPFSELPKWAEKAIADFNSGNITELIFLSKLDARVGWFKPLINTASVFCLVEGYVCFEGNDGDPAFFTTVLWYFGQRDFEFQEHFKGLGWVCQAFSRGDSQ